MRDAPHLTLARQFVMTSVSILILAGCGSPPNTPPAPTAPSTSATTPAPAEWKSAYNDEQLAIYREAVQRVAAYESEAQPIWAQGKATEAAKKFFQDNLMTWQVAWADLQSYERQGIKIARAPEVLSTEPVSIKLLDGSAAELKLHRCVDASDLGGTIEGEPLDEGTTQPVTQTVSVFKYDDGSWRFGTFDTTDTPCEG